MIYSRNNNLIDDSKCQSKIYTYDYKYKCKYKIEECSGFVSKNVDLFIEHDKSEYKKDITLNETTYTRIYGFVFDEQGNKIPNVYLTLYNFAVINYKTEYVPVSDCISDEDGEFQFIIPCVNISNNIKVKISYRSCEY